MATNNKYDRQLRLWGSHGQKALSETTIVLINASAVGTETVKNLVLPGVGGIHIVDDKECGEMDVSSNFFTPSLSSDPGMSYRAEKVAHYLGELNTDVQTEFSHVEDLGLVDWKDWLSNIKESRVLVVVADLPLFLIRSIATACEIRDCPLLMVRAYGLIGMVQLQVANHFIVESKPDSEVPDLRLSAPFPELSELAQKTRLEDLDKAEHSHIPFVIILLQALKKWKAQNNGEESTPLPRTMEQKNKFRQIVKDMARDFNNEMNFQEAHRDAYLAYSRREIPYEVTMMMEQALSHKEKPVNQNDVLLLALHQFLSENDQQPPLNGSIPDMTSATKPYIDLQNIYKNKAQQDRAKMSQIISSMQLPDKLTPSDDQIDTFCKNVYNIRHVHTRSHAHKNYTYTEEEKDDLMMVTMDPFEQNPEHTPLLWYIALEACEMFYEEFQQYPGKDDRNLALEKDSQAVQLFIQKLVEKMGLTDNDLVQSTLLSPDTAHAKEMTRYYNAEVHNIASIIGGVASQEAVKLITTQYVPLENTYIFNGIAGVAAVYKL